MTGIQETEQRRAAQARSRLRGNVEYPHLSVGRRGERNDNFLYRNLSKIAHHVPQADFSSVYLSCDGHRVILPQFVMAKLTALVALRLILGGIAVVLGLTSAVLNFWSAVQTRSELSETQKSFTSLLASLLESCAVSRSGSGPEPVHFV
jgi:hypothetical protein